MEFVWEEQNSFLGDSSLFSYVHSVYAIFQIYKEFVEKKDLSNDFGYMIDKFA